MMIFHNFEIQSDKLQDIYKKVNATKLRRSIECS